MDLPIICTLSQTEFQERRRTILNSIRESAIDVSRTAEGYVFRFKPSSDMLAHLSRLVDLESQCCRFLTFKIVVAPQQPIQLEIAGPPEAQQVMAELFAAI